MTEINPKVAIIVPVFNVEHYLHKTLDSCTKQTYRNIEIVVVDDGSTDRSADIISHFVRQDSRIKVYKQSENKGTLQARITGIQLATAEFALFLDGDDYLDLSAVEELVNFVSMQANCPDIIEFGYEEIRHNGKITIPPNYTINHVTSELDIFCSTMWNMCFKFFKMSMLKFSAYHIDKSLRLTRSEDLLHYYFLSKYTKSYTIFPKPLYKYVIRNSLCYSTPITRAVNDSYTVLNLIKKDMFETGLLNSYASQFHFNKHLRLASINQRHFNNYFKEHNTKRVELSLLSDKSDFDHRVCSGKKIDFLNMLPDETQEQSRAFLSIHRLDLIFLCYLKGLDTKVHLYVSKKQLEKFLVTSSESVCLVVNLNRFSDYSFLVRLKTLGVGLLYKKRYFFRGKLNFLNIIVDKIMHKYER